MTKLRIGRRVAMLVGAAGIFLAGPAAGAPERDNFEFLQTSAVRVVVFQPGRAGRAGTITYGTGWVAVTADPAHNANNAIIVTALHVIDGASRIAVLEANSAEQLEASVRARDVDRDIAFLEVRGLRNGGVPLTITGVVPPVGQDLRTTGYAVASDLPSRSMAEISGVLSGSYSRTVPNPRPFPGAEVGVAQFQHSIPLARGFSGGPVIDKCGRVVGLNHSNGIASSTGGADAAAGISFAIASTEIIKAAGERGIRLTEDSSRCPEQAAAPAVAGNAAQPASNQVEPSTAPSTTSWWRGQTGLAAIIGLFALAALGIAAWLFFGKSGRPPAPIEPARNRDSPRTTMATGGVTAAIIPVAAEAAGHTLTLSGKGPAGESISLRFASDDMPSQGRTMGTESEVHVPDNRAKTLVSRIHAEISWDGEHFFIKDLKSLNGTKVDGQPLAPLEKRRLRDGASVILADIALNVQID